ncbi:MAG: hypothetical protein KAI39_11590 [Desulfobulbaceae bacterium]|nr:hypothetical protein [Desulfobulbaceae bacterium]
MKPANKILIVPVICSMVAFAGCVSQKQNMIDQGYPLAYADGFDDGCHSGKKAGGNMFEQFKKDVRRFNSDQQYGQGWSDAFRQCETEQEALDRQIRMALEQQRYYEEKKHYEREEQHHLETEMLKGIDTTGLGNLK